MWLIKIALNGTSLSNLFVQNAAQFQIGLPAAGGIAALYITGTGAVTAQVNFQAPFEVTPAMAPQPPGADPVDQTCNSI